MDSIQLSIALTENQKCITIKDIEENMDLKHQKYFCPNCKNEVIARIGKINAPHFSHKQWSCSSVDAQESGLHLLCKEILIEEKVITFPKILITDKYAFIDKKTYDDCPFEVTNTLINSFEYFTARKLHFKNVQMECRLGDIVPDIVIYGKTREFLIEIAVTHFIDDIKTKKIKEQGYQVLEVDMSEFMNTSFCKEEIKQRLLYSINNKRWINFIYDDSIISSKIEEIKTKNYNIIEEYKNQSNLQKKIKNNQEKAIFKQFNDIEDEELYNNKIKKLRNDEEVKKFINKLNFIQWENFPKFLDFPIKGEIIFQCDRRIWQTDLFYKFIYNRKDGSTIILHRIINYIYKIQKAYKINYILSKKYTTVTGKEYNFSRSVITEFLLHLAKLGFILGVEDKMFYYREYLIQSKTLTPIVSRINNNKSYVCKRCGCLCKESEMFKYDNVENSFITYGICKRCIVKYRYSQLSNM